MAFSPVAFIAQVGISYLIGRLSARDGPRLQDLSPTSGEYGVAMPRVYGGGVRYACPIIAMADIKETKHKAQDYSEVIGAISGAAQGFLIGGPIGAIIGGVLGGLFGAATPDQVYYTYSVTFGLLLADRTHDDPIEGIGKVWANGRVIHNPTETPGTAETVMGVTIRRLFTKNRYYKTLTVYTGTSDQVPDPVLTAALGPQPGYVHCAYMVIEDLQLEFFGNSVPPVEAVVISKTGQTLADVAESISARAGINHIHEMSSTALTYQEVRGYAITSEANCWDALRPLLPVYRADIAENAGRLRFYKRDQPWRATIPTDHMGAHEWGNTAPERYAVTRTVDTDLPRETSLTFLDPARDWQSNTASSYRSEGDARSNVSVSLALSLTADEGAQAAAVMHWDAWLGRSALQFSLTDQWIGLTPGVAYALPVAGNVMPYRVTRKTRGANGIIEVEAVSDESVTYRGSVAGDSGEDLPPEESTLFADTVVVPLDMPMQQDIHDDFGFYITVGASQAYWNRGAVEVSGDGGATWAKLLDVTATAVMGTVEGTLAAGTTSGWDDTLDTTSVLTVETLHSQMEFESATDAQLDAWRNFAYVGKDGQGEYLQFKTATQTGPTTWELTDLRRGRRGTDHAIATHGADEDFVLLGETGVFRVWATDNTGWGDDLLFRGVTLHQDGEDADEVGFENTGEAKRPFSPIHLEGEWVGSDLALTWVDRKRFFGTDTDMPLTFEVEIRRLGVVVRTETVNLASWTYAAADQSLDGFVEGDAIHVTVYRVNEDYGRSRGRVAAFLQAGFTLHMEDGTTPILMEDGVTPIGLG